MKAKFYVESRVNVHVPGGREWALYVSLDGGSPWVVATWAKSPAIKTVEETIKVVVRSFEIYHRAIRLPVYSVDYEFLP